MSKPATASVTFTTDTADDPTVTLGNFLNNDTKFAWTGYQITLVGSEPFTITNPTLYSPAGWSISLSNSADDTQWELDASGATPIPIGGALAMSYAVNFTGSFSFMPTYMPMGTVPVPEPSTLVLAFGGLLGLAAGWVSRRRKP